MDRHCQCYIHRPGSLAVEIARSHEGANVRHGRSRTPGVGGNVINTGGINYDRRAKLNATEDEDFSRWAQTRRRPCRCSDRAQAQATSTYWRLDRKRRTH